MATITEVMDQGSGVGEDEELKAMMDAGVHFGHSKNKRHPEMQPYVWVIRNGIAVIDLTKTKQKLAEALLFLKSIAAKGGMVLFVGTRPAAKKILEGAGAELGMPYVTGRWIGGTLTNFKVIVKRIEMLMAMESQQQKGEFEKYTKKEQLRLREEINRLRGNFNGLRPLTRMPDALFVINVIEDDTAIREARRMGIPVVALVDTNANPDLVTHPIPSNDDAIPAIQYMVERAVEVMKEGKQQVREGEGQNL